MKLRCFLVLSGALVSLVAPPSSSALEIEADSVTINPANGPAQLLIQGPMFDNTLSAPGLTMGYAEAAPLPNQLDPLPLSVGLFRLNRPTGLYQWQFSGTADRLAMELKNNHSLVLHSSAAADHVLVGGQDPDTNTIELRPGANGGIFFNDQLLLSPAGASLAYSLTVGGGKLEMENFEPYWWHDYFQDPGVMAVGNDARAFGDQAVAIGAASRAGYYSVALGTYATAQYRATALGWNSWAANLATAIGGGHALGTGTVAIGPSSNAAGEWSTAVGSGAYAGPWYSVGLGGWASAANSVAVGAWSNSNDSWSGAWGTANGVGSIALGGTTYAYKGFAGASGVAWSKGGVAIGRGTVAAQDYQVVLGTLNLKPPGEWSSTFNSEPAPGDPVFVIGNGYPRNDPLPGAPTPPNYQEIRSNAFTVDYEGNSWVRGGLTVEGKAIVRGEAELTEVPAPSTFKGDVSVEGTLRVQGPLRVPESGDISMGGFGIGTPP